MDILHSCIFAFYGRFSLLGTQSAKYMGPTRAPIWDFMWVLYGHIYMERYNKPTMPENAEKYFMTDRGNQTLDLDNTA